MNKKGVLQSLFGLSLLLSLAFTGCDNFLNSSDVADEIKEEIKYTNSPVFSVRIAPESPEHGVVVSGNTKGGLRVSDEFEVEFTKNADYIFLGWDAVKKDDHSVSYNDYVKFKDTQATTTTVKIIKGNSDIYNGLLQLRPLCRAIETGIINITSSYGAISYNSESEYKEGTVLKLSITPNPGFGFTHWVVMVGNSYDTTGEYVKIDNPKNSVSDATFVKRPDNNEIIYIIPVCVERPSVISTSPSYGDNGVCRDSRIKVIFDSDMDESALYYTTPELKALGQNVEPLYSKDDPSKCYGYERDGKKYYKNIEIKDRNSGASLLKYFGEPKFTSPDMLVIPTIDTIPAYTELLVTISSNFSIKTEDDYYVSLNGKEMWNYLVNDTTDTMPPVWEKLEIEGIEGVFKTRGGSTNSTYNWTKNWTKIDSSKSILSDSDVKDNGYKYFVRNNKIKINAAFKDEGTGPSSLKMFIKNLKSGKSYSITLPIRIVSGSTAVYRAEEKNDQDELVPVGIEYDLKDDLGNDLPDGEYSLHFVAEDNAGKTTDDKLKQGEYEYYYVLLATNNPEINNNPTVTNSYTDKVVFTQTNGSTSNYLFYQMKKAGETVYSTPERITANQKTVSSLASGTTYDFKFFMCDEFGNDTNCKEFTKNTLPAQPLNVTITRDPANTKKVTIGWKKGSDPNFKGTEINVSCYKPQYGTVSSGYLVGQPQTITIPAGEQEEYTKEITNLLPGYRYQFNVAYYDGGDSYQNKYISPYTDLESIVIQPDPPKKLTVTNSNYNVGYVSLNWEAPDASGFVNQYEYSFKDSADDSAEWKKFKTDSISKEIDLSLAANGNLTGKTVKFKVESLVQKYVSPYTEFARSTSAAEFQLLVRPLNLKNFAVDSNTTSSIKVKWDSPDTDYDGIKIGYKKTSEANYTYIDVDKSATSKEITGLTNGTLYDFSYYTYKNDGNTPVNSISKSLNGNPTRPNAVTGFAATPVSGSKIKLSWTKNFGDYSGIKLYYKQYSDTNYSLLTTISNNTSTEFEWTLSGIYTGYLYDVYAVPYYISETNTGAACTSIKANTSVDAVTGLSVTATTTDSISISWTNPTTAYDSLAITYTKDNVTKDGPTVEKTATSATIPSLEAGCNYTINVTAKSKKNNTNYTKSVNTSQYTRPNAVTSLSVTRTSGSTTSLDVSWTKPSGSYKGVYVFYSTETDFSKSTYKTYLEDNSSTSYSIIGLTAGTKYYVWVVSYSGERPGNTVIKNGTSLNTTLPSSYASCYTKPNAVSSQKVTATTTGSATLSWTAPTGNVSGYRIYVKDGSGSLTYNTTVTSTSTKISSLTAGHTYTFDIRAYAAASTSNSNESDSATVTQAIRPNAATISSVSRNSNYPGSRLNVSWAYPSTGNYTGAYVFYSTENYLSSATKFTSTTGTSTTITGLSSGTYYNVWVVVYAGTDPGETAIKNSTSLNTTSTNSYQYTRPNTPTGLTIGTKDKNYVNISWTKPTSGSITGYAVYKKDLTAGTSYTLVNRTTDTSYKVESLTAGHKYEFMVRTYYGTTDNESANSGTASVYTRPPVCSFSVGPYSSNPSYAQTVSWTSYPEANRSDLFIYIFKGTSSSFTSSSLVTSYSSSVNSSTTSHIVSGLTANTKYYYWIATVVGDSIANATPALINNSVNTTVSSTNSKMTAPNQPTNFKCYMDDGMGKIQVIWDNPSSYDHVEVAVDATWHYPSKGETTSWYTISNYKRSSSYTVKIYAYNSESLPSLPNTFTYSNTTGNLRINGTSYSYSACKTIASSTVSVTRSTSYRWESSSSDKFYSAFSKASGYDYDFSYDTKTTVNTSSVSISPYSMGQYEVSQQLFKAVMGNWNPSNHTGSVYYPVENLNLYQAMLFCNKLSTMFGYTPHYKVNIGSQSNNTPKTDWDHTLGDNSYWGFSINSASDGQGFRLPNVAMWEYAARGGNPSNTTHWNSVYSGAKSTSDAKSVRQLVANCDASSPQEVDYKANSSYVPNLAGLYNMSGNVWEMTDTHASNGKIISMGGGYTNGTRCAVDSLGYDRRDDELKDRGFRICRNKTVSE